MDKQIKTDNPFSAPQADAPEAIAVKEMPHPQTLGQIGKRVFLQWEKMRLAYNGILVVFTLLIGVPLLGRFEFWVVAFFGAVASNLCYFLGPIFDTYVSWLGFRSNAVRWTVFTLGTLFTMAGATVVVFSLRQL